MDDFDIMWDKRRMWTTISTAVEAAYQQCARDKEVQKAVLLQQLTQPQTADVVIKHALAWIIERMQP